MHQIQDPPDVTLILLSFLSIYSYRNLWSLVAADAEPPLDSSEGAFFYTKFALLAITAVILPMLTPRRIVSANEKRINAEETASWFSMLSFDFLDPLIVAAYRSTAFNKEDIPPLLERDRTEYMMSYVNSLDPLHRAYKSRHVMWGLIRVFGKDYAILGSLQAILTALGFVTPFGLQQLLRYLESNGSNSRIRPWFWIAWLFFGPLLRAVVSQQYTFIATKIVVRAECILTQLLFQHSLRIRAHAGDKRSESNNFLGRLSNLATTDLKNITGIAEFWIVVLYAPLHLALCIWFLYAILEWSALVGLAVMLMLFPASGYVTRLMRAVSVESMKQTDARVQTVTESESCHQIVIFWARAHTDKEPSYASFEDDQVIWVGA
ncbi:hypothetical protein HGRIS_005643 [Hohenbuehelia grisea]|uniref:ABC transmembrane type-1 domain-containing protein n=1 Tax=Hohenbuehelia grisea TaxID=104357 RepID=A0ABR3JZR2_9AGAR